MTEAAPRNLDVPPAPVRGPRGGGRAALVALGALVMIVAVAVVLAQLDPAPPGPARVPIAVSTGAPSTPVQRPSDATAPAPDPSTVLAATTPRMNREALAAAVVDGSLEGRLVFVDGTIDHTAAHCPGLNESFGGCVDLSIPGLGLPVRQGDSAIPWRGDPPTGSWLVTVARGRGLVYLGSLVPRFGEDMPFDGVAAAEAPGGGSLFEAGGFLVQHPVHACYRPAIPATPCPPPPPFLARDEPLPDGLLVSDAGAPVTLAPAAPEIDPDATVTSGTFLVQRERDSGGGPDDGLLVVARYEPSRAVRVQAP
jgi:hypothetical protein